MIFKRKSIKIGECLGLSDRRSGTIANWVDDAYDAMLKREGMISATSFIFEIIQSHGVKQPEEIALICWLCGSLFGKLEVLISQQKESLGNLGGVRN
mgnify:CR=1 FL=1